MIHAANENSITSVASHLVLEADNLIALAALGTLKVGMIYIDPPYNTGRRFAYADSRSDWSAFMLARLIAARALMADHASIFISIGDDEYHHLRIVCDEVFGAENFIANFIWRKSHTVKNDRRGISTQHEYVLCYAKDVSKVHINREATGEDYLKRAYCHSDDGGRFRVVQLHKAKNAKSFPVKAPNGTVWQRNWSYNREGFDRLIADGLIYWGKNGTACPTKKVYLKPIMDKTFGTMLDPENVGYTGDGGKALAALGFNKLDFVYSKPPALIMHLLKIATKPDALVLDFFAGSGTTGEAVFRLNAEDGGTRRVILCNSSENDICRTVTYPRALRAAHAHGATAPVVFHALDEGRMAA
jgi:adenine-specific DNA-methyltransferase